MIQNKNQTGMLKRYLISAMLVVVGIIHLLPLSGVLGSEQLVTLYGLAITEPGLEILMRHRSVLFGILGTLFFLAAFRPEFQLIAFAAGFISVLSFIWLAWSIDGYNTQIGRVVLADIVALVCLAIGAVAFASLKTINQSSETVK